MNDSVYDTLSKKVSDCSLWIDIVFTIIAKYVFPYVSGERIFMDRFAITRQFWILRLPIKDFFYYSISVNCIEYWVGAVHLKHWLSLQNKKIEFVDFYIYPPFNVFLKFYYFNNFSEILYLKKFTYVHMLKHPPLSGYDVKHETFNQSSFLRDH